MKNKLFVRIVFILNKFTAHKKVFKTTKQVQGGLSRTRNESQVLRVTFTSVFITSSIHPSTGVFFLGWMDGRMDGGVDGWMDGWIVGWMGEWMDGWLDGWMVRWMDG